MCGTWIPYHMDWTPSPPRSKVKGRDAKGHIVPPHSLSKSDKMLKLPTIPTTIVYDDQGSSCTHSKGLTYTVIGRYNKQSIHLPVYISLYVVCTGTAIKHYHHHVSYLFKKMATSVHV